MPEICISTDVEADWLVPGLYSMLSFGSDAFTADGTLVTTFSANLKLLPDAVGDAQATAWWATQPGAREDWRPAAAVMPEYVAWIKAPPRLPGRHAYGETITLGADEYFFLVDNVDISADS